MLAGALGPTQCKCEVGWGRREEDNSNARKYELVHFPVRLAITRLYRVGQLLAACPMSSPAEFKEALVAGKAIE